jgi:hypothetical protein
MKPKDLANVWDAPDHSKLTPKQFSLRLPIQVSAKISALCQMFPRKTKTEIIGDLLSTALDQFAEGLDGFNGTFLGTHPDTKEEFYEDTGQCAHFSALTGKYLKELEAEIEGKSKD